MKALSDRHQRISALFLATFELPPPQQSALLDRECVDDPDMRAAVDRLLRQHAEPSDFLREEHIKSADLPALLDARAPAILIGRRLGGFQLVRVLASGGMGTVYEAEQERPRRTVAVKVMRFGLSSPAARRRFEYESQILAKLRHPGIAQVFEAGTFHDGEAELPFFVMELIPQARALTAFASDEKLSTARRLELFAQVCDAVHHGHQRGVIHRDLKPGNVLVDAAGTPKVIDFGVARSTDADVKTTTLHTAVGQLVGTLQYMSPEQCAGQPDDIDVRSDVYSLGVVLYELLCGQLPYDVTQLALPEALQRVQGAAPIRPSTLDRSLRGDLETILLKVLEKERARRYQSAADLADDLRRFLRHEPIEATPPSGWYRTMKFVRRNRILVGAGALVITSLVAGLVVALHGLDEAALALAKEERERKNAELQTEIAERERNAARQSERVAVMVRDFLNRDVLDVAQPELGGRETPIGRILDAAAERLPKKFEDEPLIRAEVHQTLGKVYLELGDYAASRRQVEAALGLIDGVEAVTDLEDHVKRFRLTLQTSLCELYVHEGQYAEALQLADQLLPQLEGLFDPQHSNEEMNLRGFMANAWVSLGQAGKAVELARERLRLSEEIHGPNEIKTGSALQGLALCLRRLGQPAEAEPLLLRALEIQRMHFGTEGVNVIICMNNLGVMYWSWGKHAEARKYFEEVLPICDRVLTPDHPQTMQTRGNLAITLASLGEEEKALTMFAEVVPRMREKGGDRAVWRIPFEIGWGNALRRFDQLAESREAFAMALEDCEAWLPRDAQVHLQALSGLAALCQEEQRYEEVKALRERHLDIVQNSSTWTERDRLISSIEYATGALTPLKLYAESEEILLDAFDLLASIEGEQSTSRWRCAMGVARIYRETDRPELADEWAKKAEQCRPPEVNR